MNSYLRVHAEIDLDAIRYNMRQIKQSLHKDTKVMAIIKADGYGHGALTIASMLKEEGVEEFGVAIIEEGILLRENGIKNPILILGYTSKYQYAELIQYGLTQTVFQYEMAKSISEFAVAMNQTAKIHIKLDTGMSRIGFPANEESVKIVEEISKLPNIEIEGIFTHFACADEKDKTAAKKQIAIFTQFVEMLEKVGVHIPVRHIANSAGILDLKEVQFEMVRSGIITYGLYPSNEVNQSEIKLRPALSLKSHVTFVKIVEAGVSVSYNATYTTTKKTKIATIPVGYADGYPRALSSKGKVLIHGKFAPIIGRICMDQFMVDVTEIEDVKEGDIVTLVGEDGTEKISVEEVANLAGSFNYEFVCGLGRRVPRVYKENNEIKKIVNYLND